MLYQSHSWRWVSYPSADMQSVQSVCWQNDHGRSYIIITKLLSKTTAQSFCNYYNAPSMVILSTHTIHTHYIYTYLYLYQLSPWSGWIGFSRASNMLLIEDTLRFDWGKGPKSYPENALFAADFPQTHWQSDLRPLVAFKIRNCVITLVGGWWGKGIACAFTRCMMKKKKECNIYIYILFFEGKRTE